MIGMAKFRLLQKLSPQHIQAIECHLKGLTVQQTADKVGYSFDTVAHWRSDKNYKAEFKKRAEQYNKEHRSNVATLLRNAVGIMNRVMNGDESVTPAQRNTAQRILSINHLASHGMAGAAAGTTVTREDNPAQAPSVNIQLVKTNDE